MSYTNMALIFLVLVSIILLIQVVNEMRFSLLKTRFMSLFRDSTNHDDDIFRLESKIKKLEDKIAVLEKETAMLEKEANRLRASTDPIG